MSEISQQSPFSRRSFLGTVAAGAAGLVVGCPMGARADSVEPSSTSKSDGEDQNQNQTTASDRFGRMFPRLAPFAPASPGLTQALIELGRPGGILDANDPLDRSPKDLIVDLSLSVNNPNNPTHTAGTTFFGQFLDHDITFDANSPLGIATEPTLSKNSRTPSLDLDSVYGGGPVAEQAFYNATDHIKLAIEHGGSFEDLPRRSDGTPVISDPRNDSNVIISGMHAAFIMFHNAAVDRVRASGVTNPAETFARARDLVLRHYHWIVVHEFLPQMVGQAMVDDIMGRGRRFYAPKSGKAFIPVEFQGAAYRFGHSMIRPSYRANLAGDNGQPFFALIFNPSEEGRADPDDLRGGTRAARRFVGWQTFFDFGDGQVKPNKKIDTKLSTPLFNLPLGAIASHDIPTSLPQRSLLRHLTWQLPSGQAIAKKIGATPLALGDLAELSGLGQGLDRSTPLFYYVLKEAQLVADGLHLGPVGGRIVAEVFFGLLQQDPTSYLSVEPTWRPTLPSRTPGDFRMVDLLTFAGVDPVSRGQ